MVRRVRQTMAPPTRSFPARVPQTRKMRIPPYTTGPVYYGTAFMHFLIWIYNLRIDHPTEDSRLSADDITAAFCRLLYHPDMAILWATVFQEFLVIPCGMIFGGRNSPSFYMIPGELRAFVASASDFGTITTELSESIVLATSPSPRAAHGSHAPPQMTKTPVPLCCSMIPRVATLTPASWTTWLSPRHAPASWAPSPTVSSLPTSTLVSPPRTDGRGFPMKPCRTLASSICLAPDGHNRIWTSTIRLLIPRTPTITLISDACCGGLGGWAQGHPLIWRLNKANLKAWGFILPTGREP